jgi:3-deoxy-D-manno-octulosonic-acid transferase
MDGPIVHKVSDSDGCFGSFGKFSAFCMQTGEDARRIIAIGAQPSRVNCSGNLKYDGAVPHISTEFCRELREAYHIPHDVSVLTAGSTHQGEEETLVTVYKNLIRESRSLFLVLVPRHPERAANVAELLRREGVSCTLRSGLDKQPSLFRSGEVLLVDTIGELMRFYAISDLVFVGGSMVPVGGHNILEPASLSKPVLFGPHMSNFREITSMILKFGGGVQVADEKELEISLRLL